MCIRDSNTGFKHAGTYGSAAIGISPSSIKALRAAQAKALGVTAPHACTTAMIHLHMSRAEDPAIYVPVEQ
eukprot:9666128-Alexandrium_andersonii.AAC.1